MYDHQRGGLGRKGKNRAWDLNQATRAHLLAMEILEAFGARANGAKEGPACTYQR